MSHETQWLSHCRPDNLKAYSPADPLSYQPSPPVAIPVAQMTHHRGTWG